MQKVPAYAAVLTLGLTSFKVYAIDVTTLWQKVPEPPSSVDQAVDWWRQGRMDSPEANQLRSLMLNERTEIEALASGASTERAAQTGTSSSADVEQALEIEWARYQQANGGDQAPEALLKKRTRWLQAAMGGKLSGVLAQMEPCEVPCTDPDVVTRNAPFESRKRELLDQDLAQWRALFADWKNKRGSIIRRGQKLISEVNPAALSENSRKRLAQYRRAMLHEVETLLSITELAVKRSFSIESGKVDAVTGPSRSPATH